MATTMDKRMIMKGGPFAYLYEASEGALSLAYTFDNLATGTQIVLPKADAAAASSNNLDATRADGAIIRFPAETLVVSGVDETDITPAEESTDATGKGRITIVTQEAPLPTTINSWAAFMADLKSKHDSLFLLTVATGFAYGGATAGTPKVDGWARMLCKINNDLDFTFGNQITALTLEFVSYKNPLGDDALAEIDLTGITFGNIAWKGKGSVTVAAPVITSGEATSILAGDIVISPDMTYSYA